MKNQVVFEKVNLSYSSLAYRNRSLKEHCFRLIKGKREKLITDVHALKNVSFNVAHGERVGLIGHNGAGKSTLLKAIAGLYPPSSGKTIVQGTVRALFELSLGFEPDATGRENIMYRGLLLGKSTKEMKELEEEIIAFSELKEFIDYPIKTYSSGMALRLAFAISTLVKGDILLLDEVIAAGDVKFFQKAKARIFELIDAAHVLFFASHDFNAMKELCTRCFVLDHGQILFDGDPAQAVAFYKEKMGVA